MIDSRQEELIKLLIAQERLLSRLYQVFSEQFPDHRDFWTNLSREEENHARILEKLIEAGKKGVLLFNEGRINTFSLKTSIQGLKGLVEKAEQGGFTLSSALSCSIDYESALIEKNAFTRFEPVSKKAGIALNTLKNETTQHIERIKTLKTSLPPK